MHSSALVLAVLCVAACDRSAERSSTGDGAVVTTSGTMEGARAAPTIIVNPPASPPPTVNVIIAMPSASGGVPTVSTSLLPAAPGPAPAAQGAAPPGAGAVLSVSPSGRPAIVNAADDAATAPEP